MSENCRNYNSQEKVALFLNEEMTKQGLTVKDLASKARMTAMTIENVLNPNSRSVEFHNVVRVANALGFNLVLTFDKKEEE